MGHAFNEFIVCSIRQAIPVIAAVMGAYYGSQRAGRSGRRQLANVAAFAGLGWLGGYVLRSTLLFLIEGRRPALPTATANEFPPPVQPGPVEPSMTSVAVPPTSGLPNEVDPYSFSSQQQQVSTVDQSGAPPPKTNNEGVSYGPLRVGRGPNGKSNNTLVTSAYGNVYGN